MIATDSLRKTITTRAGKNDAEEHTMEQFNLVSEILQAIGTALLLLVLAGGAIYIATRIESIGGFVGDVRHGDVVVADDNEQRVA